MQKSKLKDVAVIRFPQKIRLDVLTQGDKIQYIYAARKISSRTLGRAAERSLLCDQPGHTAILEVDFFSLKDKAIEFRVFISNKDFITQSFIPEPKWITSQLDKLVNYYGKCENLVALYERSNKTIVSFLTPKLKDYSPAEPPAPLQLLAKLQSKIVKGRLAKKHQKIKDRIDSEFIDMDKMPKNINDWIEKYPLWHNQYIFYKRKGKKISGYCSACKSEVYPEQAKHKLPGVCPSCGCPVTFKAEGRSKRTSDKFIFSYIQKGINGSIIQRVYEGYKSYRDGFDKPDIRIYEERRYIYKDGKYKAHYHGDFKKTGDYRWCEGFRPRLHGMYNFTDCGSLYFDNLREALRDTEWRDCRLEKFADTKMQFDAMDYLALYRKQPEIRFLVESGLDNLILEVFYDRYNSNPRIEPEVFNILNDNKAFFNLFRKIRVTSNELKLISKFSSKKFIKEDILLRIRETGQVNEFAPIFKYTTPVKALNYLEKQVSSTVSFKDALIYWQDYLKLADFLDYDMSSSFVVFPGKLRREHDRVNDEYGKVACLKGEDKIALMTNKVNSLFRYENDKFIIRAPRHGKEIKDEGANLRHCVGGYVDNMAKLSTFILLLCEKEDITKPYYTVEFRDNEVRQCRGFKNSSATPEVDAFLDEWKGQLYKKERRQLAAA